jgi:hypothetical protein
LREYAKTGGAEDISFDFAFVALGWDFFAVELEADAGGVSCLDYDFAGGSHGGVGGGDQGFLGYGFAVGGDGDPSIFLGADEQAEAGGWFRRRIRSSANCACGIGAGRVR